MALVNKPDENIFASSAKQGEVDNFPDLLRGWGITFDQTQGIPPMEWFNFLFKRLDEKHAYLMQRGLPEWSATQDYTKGSCVQFDSLSYRALKANKNKQPNEANSQYWIRWGFTLTEIAKATLTQYGLTQLYTGYDSQREDVALTPKTAFMLKALIDSLTRNLSNYIPNSKKSNAVNSPSSDTIATSAAAKTAYDKGVEAKNAAGNAQRTANAKQSPSTTLSGYGITDFVVKGEPSTTNARDLNSDGIYAFGSGGKNLPINGAFKV
ncbi:phage tail protein, partial [Rodentibacter ratti]|uniref:phage tail protein n=1 Tax=Rodentibacter ratti TaxID=1906745 RepID=UPI0015C3B14D